MTTKGKSAVAVIAATAWIGGSEFLRNEVLLKGYWINHYESMGLAFPSELINGAVWGVWSLCFAGFIFVMSRKFSLLGTFILSWFAGFLLMWLVVGNLAVLPFDILWFAVPWSLIEAFLASVLVERIAPSAAAS